MRDDEFQALKANIKDRGLLEPIITYEEAILDGRHRHQICVELNLKPDYIDFTTLGYNGSALDFVISRHLRRNLTPDQKALLADKLANLKKGERQVLNNEKVTLEQAEKLTGASKGQVGMLRKLRKHKPDIIERIEAGMTTINAEYQILLAQRRSQARAAEREKCKQELERMKQLAYTGTLPEQEQQRTNACIALEQQNEAIRAEVRNKNALCAALVQLVSSVETLKEAVKAFGIEETLAILAGADQIYGASQPLLLLANVRADVDEFLAKATALHNTS